MGITKHVGYIPITLDSIHDSIVWVCAIARLPYPQLPDTLDESVDVLIEVREQMFTKIRSGLIEACQE